METSLVTMLDSPTLENYLLNYIDPLVDQVIFTNRYHYELLAGSKLFSNAISLLEKDLSLKMCLGGACFCYYPETIKYLIYKYRDRILESSINFAIKASCASGQMESVKLIIKLNPNFLENIFIKSCKWDNLEITKLIFELSEKINSPIDINRCGKKGFDLAFNRKNYQTAIWIVDMVNKEGTPINIDNEFLTLLNNTTDKESAAIILGTWGS